MPFANLPPQGTFYIPNYHNVNWTQPGGPNTTVFPQEKIGVPMAEYPVPGQIWAENSGLWVMGCGHWQNAFTVFRDFDNMLGSSVAVLCCSLCSFIQRYIYPYESIDDEFNFPILVP